MIKTNNTLITDSAMFTVLGDLLQHRYRKSNKNTKKRIYGNIGGPREVYYLYSA
jgi:hypothetical protein